MIAVNRSAAGTWCGASQAGQLEDDLAIDAGGGPAPSSSARAALATTARGGASPAGSRATARGSAIGTRCSERIRGQRAAVGGIELEGLRDKIIGGLAAGAAAG
jgi:hypothetical protein